MADSSITIEELNSRLNDVEALLETANFNLYHDRVNRLCLEEIIELSVIQHFNVKRRDFHENVYANIGNPRDQDSYARRVINSRQWFMSIMVNMLHRTSYKMKWNYPKFFDQKKVERHRNTFMSGVEGTNKENRITFMSLCGLIREMIKEEKLMDEEFIL